MVYIDILNLNMILMVTKIKYDSNGFDINSLHKDTKTRYDFNGFNKDGLHWDTKTKYDSNGFDINGLHKDKIKTEEARFFKDQKGKGHVDLPILLYKIYTNNNSKELIKNIKQLINNLYDNKQITKQVYNILNKTITYA